MKEKLLFAISLLIFTCLPYQLDLSEIWLSITDPEEVNEIAVAIYWLFESITQIIA
ncbi:MAG: hypothetical protein GTO02_17115 [Candidatus Dadabacteria bacterium]|nr:hypothetical protein [Candidatus Dadabacteria bacterium]NIQ16047.1 hypothetical protein [Candidatus Dadabacteria bacterium]